MGRNVSRLVLPLVVALTACEDGIAPVDRAIPIGIDFGAVAGQTGGHSAEGIPRAAAPLDGPFAVAVRDSLGGTVLVSFDRSRADLFVLQVTGAGGACGRVETAPACHGRVFRNLRIEAGEARFDARLDMVAGHVAVQPTSGGQRLQGSLDGRLEQIYPRGEGVVEIEHGTIDVPYVDDALLHGGLGCLVALAGADGHCP